jgi:ubiquinone/menaquinone biosynthesis C-methylase UbiE
MAGVYGRNVGSDLPERDDLEAIRETYSGYDDSGRDHLWDRTNPGFDRLKSQAEERLLLLLRSSMGQTPLAILDVGCGNGDLAALARERGVPATWTGIDLLPDRIATAAMRIPDGRFIVGSADAMPLLAAEFDVVAAVTMFSSLPTPELEARVAKEIARVLRPAGWLIWYDLRYDNPSNPAVHGVTTRRLAELFPGWRQELHSLTVAPPIARRLGRLTPIAYPVLHAIPPLRSHLVGRLQRP